jgi:hypothetical protein
MQPARTVAGTKSTYKLEVLIRWSKMIFTDFSFLQPFPYPYCKHVYNVASYMLAYSENVQSLTLTKNGHFHVYPFGRKLLQSST